MEEKTVKPKTAPTPAPPNPSDVAESSVDAPQEAPPKDVKIPDPNKSDSPGPEVDTLIPSDPYYLDPLFYEVASYFGIEREEYASSKNKLSEIVDYVIKSKKSNSPGDVLLTLREIEEKIQPPAWGEKRYTNVFRYVRLLSKKGSLEQAMSAFEKHGYQRT